MRLDKGRTQVIVPRESLLLLSGIPAVGKSTFGRYLARKHNFAHYDLECHPRGWPHPELKRVWDSSRANFVAQLKERHDRIALDWGFPPQAMPQVRELLALGVRCVWFAGNVATARKLFIERSGIPVADFDIQVRRIEEAGLPEALECTRVEALTRAGTLRAPSAILREIFRE
jgi:hypothetical protein